jgi:hypothetical protein
MLRYVALWMLVALCGLLSPPSGSAAEACHQPPAPGNFPEGTSATETSIVAAQQSVKQYLSEMEGTLKCYELGHLDHARDVAVDDMKKVAAKFNAVLKAYKAKQAG